MRLPRRPGRVASIAVALGAFGMMGLRPAPGPDPDRDDIYAAALGYAAEQLANGRVTTVCVGVDLGNGAQDPSPGFLDRFEPVVVVGRSAPARRFLVRPASECKVSKDGATLRDGRTPAVTLTARALDRVSEAQVLVEVLYVFTWRQRGIRTYEVTRIDTPRGPLWRAAGEVMKQAPF